MAASTALARRVLRYSMRSHQTHAHAAAGVMDVAIIDPLLILEPERLVAARQAAAASASAGDPASVQPYVTVSVPFRLLSLLHQGQLELADHDDPGNHWYFGERGELFQYKFVGRHRVESGFTSLVLAHELQARYGGCRLALEAAPPQKCSRKQASLEERSWLAFLQHVKGSSGEGLWPTPSLPFLFAGKAIDCESVGVYGLGGAGGAGTTGLMLSTEYDTPH